MAERALNFECAGETLVGIIHRPDIPPHAGVLIVVGGPQYRVGSHRQFVLLARHLARQGILAFRFDYRGIGDGGGVTRTFLNIERDIESALDHFCDQCPELSDIYIWGLCDAASAALLYAYQDRRITGLILSNPWVRTEAGLAKALVTDYYFKQLMSVNFWLRLFSGNLKIMDSLRSAIDNLRSAFFGTRADNVRVTPEPSTNQPQLPSSMDESFPDRMLEGLKKFKGRILFIMSGDDLTATEFNNLVDSSAKWKKALRNKQIVWRKLPKSNHTFSTRIWRDQVAEWTAQWILKK